MRGNLVVAALFAVTLVVFGAPASGAVSASPTRGYMGNAGGSALAVFDPATNTITDRVPLDFSSYVFEVRPDGREIYVVDIRGARVVVISTATNTVVATIPLGRSASDVAFTPDNRRAYVTGESGLTVIDTTARRVIATVPLGDIALDSAVSPDGTRVYTPIRALVGVGSEYSLKVTSTATNRVTKSLRLRTGGVPPNQVIFAPNGRIAMLDTGEVIDTSDDTLSHTITLRLVADFEFTPDSDRIYFADFCFPNDQGSIDLVDVASGRIVSRVSTGGNPRSLDLTGDGTRLYVTVTGAITELDATTGRVLDTFGVANTNGVGQVELSETAPPATAPGQRFAPRPPAFNPCII